MLQNRPQMLEALWQTGQFSTANQEGGREERKEGGREREREGERDTHAQRERKRKVKDLFSHN